jgi:hypothetical protein
MWAPTQVSPVLLENAELFWDAAKQLRKRAASELPYRGNALAACVGVEHSDPGIHDSYRMLPVQYMTTKGTSSEYFKNVTYSPVHRSLDPLFVLFLSSLHLVERLDVDNARYRALCNCFEHIFSEQIPALSDAVVDCSPWRFDDENTELSPAKRFTNTEIILLFDMWRSKSWLNDELDPTSRCHLSINIFSMLDVCDTCSFCLLHAAACQLFCMPAEFVIIRAFCWKRTGKTAGIADASIWGRPEQTQAESAAGQLQMRELRL